jgi:isopenicillin-N N-acyltransferase like protein
MASRQLPVIHIYGAHYQMGCQMGEACRDQVQHSIANAHTLIADAFEHLQLTWEGAQIQAKKYIPFAEERYPQYVEELKGIANGANVSFDDVAVVNGMEAVTMDALHLTKCTSMAISPERSANGNTLVAHNEDWIPEDEADVFLIHARPVDEPPFLAMTYGALLPNIGLNAYGLVQCCDSVYPGDSRIGIPRVVVSRAVLAARTPGDAIRHTLIRHRAAGYNHLIVHESGEIYNVEVSSRRFALLYADNGILVHTNHYLDPQMQAIESEPDELVATRVRYFRALRLLRQTELHTVMTLQAIQKDHLNHPDSICNHANQAENPLDREKTVTALILDPINRQIHATWGNPCDNAYFTYQLD